MKLGPLALLGLGLVVVAGGAKGSPPNGDEEKANGGTNGKAPVVPTGERAEVRANLQGFADIMQINLDWSLAELLDLIAFTESRWTWRPKGRVPKTGSNKAVGPYQLRPNSAGDTKELRARFKLEPWLLEHPTVATAAIVAYLSRMSTQNPAAIKSEARASLSYPMFIHGRPTKLSESLAAGSPYKTLAAQQGRYDRSVERFYEGAEASGVQLPQWFANTFAFPRAKRYTVLQLLPMMGWPTLPPVGVDPWDW